MKYLRLIRSSATFRILLIALSAMGVAYQLLFSPWGNRLLYPVIENILSKALSTSVEVEEFTLGLSRFDLMFKDEAGNTVSTQGGYSLLTLRLYAHYRVDYLRKGGMNSFGIPLKTEGSLSGGISAFDIRGTLHAFEGDALYRVQLRRFALSSVHADLNSIAYEPLLRFFDYPSVTDTRVWGHIDLKGFDRRSLKGEIRLVAKTDRFEPAELLPDDNESFDFRSLLADERGHIKPFDVNVTLKASMEHAGILEQFAGVRLSGPAALTATLSGDEQRLELSARSSVAQSKTSVLLLIPDLEPQRLEIDMSHADIPSLFTLFSLPSPMNGKADLKGELTPQGGRLDIRISRASTIPDVLRRDYNITQPPLRFDAEVSAHMNRDGVNYRGRFVSDLKRLDFSDSAPHDDMLRELLKTFR